MMGAGRRSSSRRSPFRERCSMMGVHWVFERDGFFLPEEETSNPSFQIRISRRRPAEIPPYAAGPRRIASFT